MIADRKNTNETAMPPEDQVALPFPVPWVGDVASAKSIGNKAYRWWIVNEVPRQAQNPAHQAE